MDRLRLGELLIAAGVLDRERLQTALHEHSKNGLTSAQLVYGVAAHDTHHGGQIQLLKRLWHGRSSPSPN